MTGSDLIQTGIYGLDEIFLGGILKGNLILVEGAAGAGKTLMGLEFIYRGITEHDEPGIIVVFETSPRKLIRDATGFGWNLDELEQRKTEESRQVQEEMDRLVTEHRARIQANADAVAKERERFFSWRLQKQQEEQKIADTVSHFVTENPITRGVPTDTPAPGKGSVK